MRQTQLDDSSQVTGNKDGVEFLTQNRIDIQNIQCANESIQATLRTFEEKFIVLNGELGKTNQELQKTNDMNKSLLQMNAGMKELIAELREVSDGYKIYTIASLRRSEPSA